MGKFINLACIDFAGGGSAPVPPVPPGPTPVVTAKDVNLRDYDGTIVASYTKAEFAELSALPENPTHEGLTAQGWNWSLANAKTYVAAYGKLEVGQMYITSDGKTRIHITLTEGRTSPVLGITLYGSLDVDWGDGSAHDTLTGVSISTIVNQGHSYAAPGDYTIILTPAQDSVFAISGDNTVGSKLLWAQSSSANSVNHVYQTAVKRIEIGSGVTMIRNNAFRDCYSLSSVTIPQGVTYIGTSAFQNCNSLSSVTIPDSVTTIDNNVFYGCCSLSSVTIPNSITTIGNYEFQNCYSLSRVTIPDSVTSIKYRAFINCYGLSSMTIPNSVISIEDEAFWGCLRLSSVTITQGVTTIYPSAFYGCYSLSSVTIPDSVTSIYALAFSQCYSLSLLSVNRSTPPTLNNSNALSNTPTDLIIYVPAASVDAYKAASGWSTYASQIQAMP